MLRMQDWFVTIKSINIWRQIKTETVIYKSMGHSKRSSKRELYRGTSLPQKTRKISNKQSNLTLKGTIKE